MSPFITDPAQLRCWAPFSRLHALPQRVRRRTPVRGVEKAVEAQIVTEAPVATSTKIAVKAGRLGQKVIDGHFTYELTFRQADVQMRDSTERATMDFRNDALGPLHVCFLRK
jgi:hypothetical protein